MKISSILVLSAVALLGSLSFTSESVAQQPPSDANIGAIVLAANQIDIDYGKLALTESKNKEVLAFAQQMVTDHGAVQKSVIELAGKLQLTPRRKRHEQQSQSQVRGSYGKAEKLAREGL